MAAINHLDYGAMLDFLGVNPCTHRADLYARIKDDLSSDAASFWQKHPELIEAGVIYQGTWEQYMRSIAQCLTIKKSTISKLFSCRSLEEQQQIWNKEWKSFYWSTAMYLIGRRFLWQYVLKEPGIHYIPKDFDITDYLKSRFDFIANTQLFYSNPYLNLLFNGKYSVASLPVHLQEQSHHQLKNRLNQISIMQSSLQQIGETPNQYTAFSISDFSSYSDKAHYESCWQNILKAARPHAKFVERSFLVKHDLPSPIAQQVNINQQLSKKLTEQDHSFIYDIRCGTINKDNFCQGD